MHDDPTIEGKSPVDYEKPPVDNSTKYTESAVPRLECGSGLFKHKLWVDTNQHWLYINIIYTMFLRGRASLPLICMLCSI